MEVARRVSRGLPTTFIRALLWLRTRLLSHEVIMSALVAARPFNLLLTGGKKLSFKEGDTIPDEHADHWYVKANVASADVPVEGADEEPKSEPADTELDRAGLIAKANSLGISVDGRWSLSKIKAAVEAAEK